MCTTPQREYSGLNEETVWYVKNVINFVFSLKIRFNMLYKFCFDKEQNYLISIPYKGLYYA